MQKTNDPNTTHFCRRAATRRCRKREIMIMCVIVCDHVCGIEVTKFAPRSLQRRREEANIWNAGTHKNNIQHTHTQAIRKPRHTSTHRVLVSGAHSAHA